MNRSLSKKLEILNGELDKLVNQLQGITHEQFNSSPAPDKWSAAQIMNHLMLAESGSLKYCQKKLSFDPDLPPVGLKTYLRSALLCYSLYFPIKVKAPKGFGTEYLPQEDNLQSVLERWIAQRQQLKDFLLDLPEKYLHREVYKHPLTGRMSLEGMLSFFHAHFKHHKHQILKAVACRTGKS